MGAQRRDIAECLRLGQLPGLEHLHLAACHARVAQLAPADMLVWLHSPSHAVITPGTARLV